MKHLKYFEDKSKDDIVDDIKGLLVELGDINIVYFVEHSVIGITVRLERESKPFKLSDVRDVLITIEDYLKEYYNKDVTFKYTSHYYDNYGRKQRDTFDIHRDNDSMYNLTMFTTHIRPEVMNSVSDIWNSIK